MILIANLGLTVGLTAVATGINYLLNRNKDRERRVVEAKRLVRTDIAAARWIAGRARVGGVIVAAFELWQPPLIYRYPSGQEGQQLPKHNTLYLAVLIADGPIGGIERIWINDVEFPFRELGGSNSDYDGAFFPAPSEFTPRATALRRDADALGAPTDSVLLSMQRDLNARASDLDDAQAYRWFAVPNNPDPRVNATGSGPTCVIAPDYGGAGMSPADRLAKLASAAAALDPRRPFDWTDAHRLDGLSWCWIELTNYRDDASGESGPWTGAAPAIQFLVRGALDGNPAKVARWYLTQRCGVSEQDIDSTAFQTAADRCDEQVVVPLPDRNSTLGRAWLAAAYGPESAWPTAPFQDAFLREVWNRYGGQKPRYGFNAVIESDEDRGSVLDAVAGAMAGHVIDLGGSWSINAGQPQGAVDTLPESRLLAAPAMQLAPPVGNRFNSFAGRLAYDSQRDWESTALPPVRDDALIATDGLIERDVGQLPGAADEVTGRRLLAIQLRRASPTLRRMTIQLAPDAPFRTWERLTAGRIVQLDFPTHGVRPSTQWMIQQASPRLDGSLSLSLVEERPGTYDADINFTYGALWGARRRGTGLSLPGTALGVNALAQWTQVNESDGSSAFALDVRLRTGADVRMIAMTLTVNVIMLDRTGVPILRVGAPDPAADDYVNVPMDALDGSEWTHRLRWRLKGGIAFHVLQATGGIGGGRGLHIVPYPLTPAADGSPRGTPGAVQRFDVFNTVTTRMAGLADVSATRPKDGQILRSDGSNWRPADPYIVSENAPDDSMAVPVGSIWWQVTDS